MMLCYKIKLKTKYFRDLSLILHYTKFKDLTFGIIELPIHKYSSPIAPTVKIKGLEVGKIYFRRGSANTEALGNEIINIHEWLKSLPETNENISVNNEITNLIKKLTTGDEKLSIILADILSLAKINKFNELANFCTSELTGINTKISDANPEEFKYRVISVKVSINKIEIEPFSPINVTEAMIKNEVENHKDYHDVNMLFTKSITETEECIKSFNEKTICTTIKTTSKKFLKDNANSDYTVYIYIFRESYKILYRNIRQKAIDKLMEAN